MTWRDLPEIGFRELRRTHESILEQMDLNLLSISKLLGHTAHYYFTPLLAAVENVRLLNNAGYIEGKPCKSN